MTILFLDDMDVRHSAFREWAAEAGFVVDSAYTAEDAIAKLEKHEYLAACLDHDLAEEHYAGPYASPSMGGTAHSGRAVARWIAEHGRPTIVWIHSFNPDGAEAIKGILQQAQPKVPTTFRAPFGPSSGRHFLSVLKLADVLSSVRTEQKQ